MFVSRSSVLSCGVSRLCSCLVRVSFPLSFYTRFHFPPERRGLVSHENRGVLYDDESLFRRVGGRCFWDRILPWVGVGVCVVLSGLLFLATQWSAKWNSWIAFRPSSLAEATHIFVSPVDLERVSPRIVLLLGKNASNPKPLLVEQENALSEPSSSEKWGLVYLFFFLKKKILCRSFCLNHVQGFFLNFNFPNLSRCSLHYPYFM